MQKQSNHEAFLNARFLECDNNVASYCSIESGLRYNIVSVIVFQVLDIVAARKRALFVHAIFPKFIALLKSDQMKCDTLNTFWNWRRPMSVPSSICVARRWSENKKLKTINYPKMSWNSRVPPPHSLLWHCVSHCTQRSGTQFTYIALYHDFMTTPKNYIYCPASERAHKDFFVRSRFYWTKWLLVLGHAYK